MLTRFVVAASVRSRTDCEDSNEYKVTYAPAQSGPDMIRNAFTGESWTPPKSLAQQETDFTAEGAPAPGDDELKRQAAADEAAKAPLRAPIADSATNARVASPAR